MLHCVLAHFCPDGPPDRPYRPPATPASLSRLSLLLCPFLNPPCQLASFFLSCPSFSLSRTPAAVPCFSFLSLLRGVSWPRFFLPCPLFLLPSHPPPYRAFLSFPSSAVSAGLFFSFLAPFLSFPHTRLLTVHFFPFLHPPCQLASFFPFLPPVSLSPTPVT